MGQIHQSSSMNSAHINYLLQPENADAGDLVVLLEGLLQEAGQWGAKQVTADLETYSPLFPQFRQAGFSVLAKQRVFRTSIPQAAPEIEGGWRIWNSADVHVMRRLYLTLVPPLIQPVEPLTRREMLGLIFYDRHEALQAYADLVYGPVGIWVLPLIHPQTEIPIDALLAGMLRSLPDVSGRPVFVTARSYQPWVESGLEALGGDPGPEQAVMIHYLALRQRVGAELPFAHVENGKPEPTVPYSPAQNYPE